MALTWPMTGNAAFQHLAPPYAPPLTPDPSFCFCQEVFKDIRSEDSGFGVTFHPSFTRPSTRSFVFVCVCMCFFTLCADSPFFLLL